MISGYNLEMFDKHCTHSIAYHLFFIVYDYVKYEKKSLSLSMSLSLSLPMSLLLSLSLSLSLSIMSPIEQE